MSETAAQPGTEPTAAATADPLAPPPPVLGGEPPASGEPAPAAAEPPAPAVPEAYEFAAPEIDGKPLEVDAAALDAFKGTAKELGLTQEQFQGVVEAGGKRIAELAAAPYRAWHDQQRAWTDEIKADPEIGGDKLPAALAQAAKVLDAFGGADLRQALVVTGAGNNPAVVRAFVAIGRAMGDANGLLTGRPAAGIKPRTGEQAARDVYNQGGGNYPDLPA